MDASRTIPPNPFARGSAACYFLWGVMHIWVGATVVFERIVHGPVEALVALGSPATDMQASPAIAHASNVAADFAINLGAAGILGCWLGLLIWRSNSSLARWLNGVILGLVDVSFVLCLLAPGYIPLLAGIWGPVLYVAGVFLGGIGASQLRQSA